MAPPAGAESASKIVVRATYESYAPSTKTITYSSSKGTYSATWIGVRHYRLRGTINGRRLTGTFRTRQRPGGTRYLGHGLRPARRAGGDDQRWRPQQPAHREAGPEVTARRRAGRWAAVAAAAMLVGPAPAAAWDGERAPNDPLYDIAEEQPATHSFDEEQWFMYSFIPRSTPFARIRRARRGCRSTGRGGATAPGARTCASPTSRAA